MTAEIRDVRLAAREYMFALSPEGRGTGRSFLQASAGAQGYGTPSNDHRNWFHSDFFGAVYIEAYEPWVPAYSCGWGIPCPASFGVIALAGLRVSRRRPSHARTFEHRRR